MGGRGGAAAVGVGKCGRECGRVSRSNVASTAEERDKNSRSLASTWPSGALACSEYLCAGVL